MRRRWLFVAGLVAVIGLILRARRRSENELPAPDPANELRQKLDEARELETSRTPARTEGLEARRRSVHERARAAAEEMGRPASD